MNAQAQYAGYQNPHVAEATTHLKAAIKHGDKGHAHTGTTHASEALTHLNAAK
jgi:hypothetical protein